MPPAESDLRNSLFRRHPANPILTARHWPYPVNTVFNAGAVRLETSGESGTFNILGEVEDFYGKRCPVDQDINYTVDNTGSVTFELVTQSD